MGIKTLLGISGCSVVGTLVVFAILVTALLAMAIPQMPFGQEQAWQWMLGTPQPVRRPLLPSPDGKPIISGNGQWCVTRAYQETPEESHLNAGRVQGYARDANGLPLAGVAVHVSWDGDEGGITQITDANGYYVFILSPGEYRVQVAQGQSQVVSFRTNLRAYYGHYTYDVDFASGNCFSQSSDYTKNPSTPKGLPVSGRITATFHDWQYLINMGRIHEGVDIAVNVGTPVAATMSGKVTQGGNYGSWGNMVIVQNGPWEIIVAHLSEVNVKLGQEISMGSVLGKSGNTGFSTGPHVHYEVRYNGMAIDPQNITAYLNDVSNRTPTPR
ncbi:MAG: peptidoglycan DD-metalloendopeptidase family protein [Chloroflexi bacterium]|nr:peptidoglycan DD-metalloendopeptidase family protein [Chloroflexota bacterium]